MYHMRFNTNTGARIFEINYADIPVPRVGEKVSYNNEHYVVDEVKHRFHYIEGPESTGVMITLSLDPDMVFPAQIAKPLEVAAPPLPLPNWF